MAKPLPGPGSRFCARSSWRGLPHLEAQAAELVAAQAGAAGNAAPGSMRRLPDWPRHSPRRRTRGALARPASPRPARRSPRSGRRPAGRPPWRSRSRRSGAPAPSGSGMRSCALRSFRRRCCAGGGSRGPLVPPPRPRALRRRRGAGRGAGRPGRRRRGGGPALCGYRPERDRRLVGLALLHGLAPGAASPGHPPRPAEHHHGRGRRQHREPRARHHPRAASLRASRGRISTSRRPSRRCGGSTPPARA